MKPAKPGTARTAGIVAIAVSFLFFAILAGFFVMRQSEKHRRVELPDAPAAQPKQEKDGEKQPFLTLQPENVGSAVATLARPRYYHEVCTLTRYWNEQQSVEQVERWVSGAWTKIVVSGASGAKTYLSDGAAAYLWYDDGAEGVTAVQLAGTTPDDLAGIPSYETVVQADPAQIRKASYVELGAGTDCIFAEFCPDEAGYYDQLWIDAATGTLYKANACREASLIYQMQRSELTVYAANDTAFDRVFVLPDGRCPFDTEN